MAEAVHFVIEDKGVDRFQSLGKDLKRNILERHFLERCILEWTDPRMHSLWKGHILKQIYLERTNSRMDIS